MAQGELVEVNTAKKLRRTQLRPTEGRRDDGQARSPKPEETPRSRSPIRILRLPQVMDAVGLRRAVIYKLQSEGRFPKRVKITGGRAVGRIEEEIQAWLAKRVESDELPPASSRCGYRRHAIPHAVPQKSSGFP
jgi:prophage regulatory protein